MKPCSARLVARLSRRIGAVRGVPCITIQEYGFTVSEIKTLVVKNDSNKKSPTRTGAGLRAGLTASGIILMVVCGGCGSIHGVQGNVTWYQGFGGKFGGSNLNNDMIGIGFSFPIGKQ